MSEEPRPTCKYCWIEAIPQPDYIRQVGKSPEVRGYIHAKARDAVGNPVCDRGILTEEDLDYPTHATE